MPWRGESYPGEFPSLGWRLLEWYAEYLRVPSGPMVGQPFELTDEQAGFVVRFYRLDENGERVYRRAVLRRPKGWGKSPLLAAYAVGELCGPVVFDGWDAAGDPVGVVHGSPWVQIAACSEDQTDNTYVALYEMLRESPAPQELGLDVGLTRIFLEGRPGRIEPVTASSGSREGQPATAAVLDETHLWLPNNGGTKLAATIRRNVGKMGGSSIESTNAYVPGESSVAEASETARQKGQKGVLLDVGAGIEMRAKDLRKRSRAMSKLRKSYGDSVAFVPIERIYEETTDADTSPDDALRYFYNQIVHRSEQAFDVTRWAELADATAPLADKDLVVLGFDGARFHDATGVVVTHVESGHQLQRGLWESDGSPEWEVDATEVTETLAHLFDTYEVWRLYADPWYWETQVNSEWPARFGVEKVIAWDTRPPKKTAYAIRSYVSAQRAGEMSHDGDADFARHIANARKRETNMRDEEGRRLWVIQKEHSSSENKIDLAMAGVLSWEARGDAIAAGATKKRKSSATFV